MPISRSEVTAAAAKIWAKNSGGWRKAASDPTWSEEGPRNMKYKGPPMAATFIMTSFNRDRGGHGPLGSPPGSAAGVKRSKKKKSEKKCGDVLPGPGVQTHLHMDHPLG